MMNDDSFFTMPDDDSLRDAARVTLEEATVTLEGRVKEIHGTAHTYMHHNGVYGPGSYSEPSGSDYTSIITLDRSVVKRIHFGGWPPIERGDSIRVYIVAADREPELFGGEPPLVPRDLRAEETAFKLEKLRRGEVVGTYVNPRK